MVIVPLFRSFAAVARSNGHRCLVRYISSGCSNSSEPTKENAGSESADLARYGRRSSSSALAATAPFLVMGKSRRESPTSTFSGNREVGRRSVHVERRLEELGIVLPSPPEPKANYNIVCYAPGNLLYVSGHLPIRPDGTVLTGRIGPGGGSPDDGGQQTLEHGYEAARHAGLNIVATLKSELGDLDRVEQVVKIFGIVQSTSDFKEQHKVMDGCSDVLMEVFGRPVGYHARSAIGTSTLPIDISVEVEAIVQYKP